MTRQVASPQFAANQLVYDRQDYDPYIEDEHPVVVVDSEPHSYTSYHGDEFVVTDDHHSNGSEELKRTEERLVRGLGEITAWLGSHFGFIPSTSNGGQRYFDSRHDLDMARVANKFL